MRLTLIYSRNCEIIQISKDEVDEHCTKLTSGKQDGRFNSYTTIATHIKIIQIPPTTNFLCIHFFRSHPSQENAKSVSLCMTSVFANGAISPQYEECFANALVISDLMTSTKNKKKVMIGNKTEIVMKLHKSLFS